MSDVYEVVFGGKGIQSITARIDLTMLKEQKQWLVEKAWEEDTEHIVWGLVHLLDELQDALEVTA